MFKEIYGYELHPFWKLLGVTRVCKTSIEFKWGYISFGHGPEFQLDHTYEYGVPRICMCLIWMAINIELPFLKQRYEDVNESPRYGFKYHSKGLWWHWRLKNWVFHMPWDWDHISHMVMTPTGWSKANTDDYEPPYSDNRIVESYPYTYVLSSFEIQQRTATIYQERREWRWRWFKWLPFPRMIRTSIDVSFSDEVGEKTGSWKGGTVGCGYDILPNESMLRCLRRMERDRTF